jgi:hypothetical protein
MWCITPCTARNAGVDWIREEIQNVARVGITSECDLGYENELHRSLCIILRLQIKCK